MYYIMHNYIYKHLYVSVYYECACVLCFTYSSPASRLQIVCEKKPKDNFKQQYKNDWKKKNKKKKTENENCCEKYIRICTYTYMHAHVHNRHVCAVCVCVYPNLPLKWKFKQKHLSTLNKLLTTATTLIQMIDATNRSRWRKYKTEREGMRHAPHLTSLSHRERDVEVMHDGFSIRVV